MAYNNGWFTSPIISQQNVDPTEGVYSSVLGTSNDFAIMVQIISEVNRAGYPLPDPEESPSQEFHVSIYPKGVTDVRDTAPYVTKTISASGESIIKSIKFEVVGMNKCQIKVTNANDFGVVLQAAMTEAKLT